jgi:hypothetical protein
MQEPSRVQAATKGFPGSIERRHGQQQANTRAVLQHSKGIPVLSVRAGNPCPFYTEHHARPSEITRRSS